jgi:hypothetical protein
MSKAPGFWFFTGDWMKDPELRFCSIFARGLLVDLLCILFEARERGYASNPDGTARTDLQIVDAITGSSREEKLAALNELEKSGVLSRDNRGVLFSRRLARMAEVSKERSNSGSKGGSKTQAKLKQTAKQKTKLNRGVSDSDSDTYTGSVSGSVLTPTPSGRVCLSGDHARDDAWGVQGTWETFRQAWNSTANTKPWHALGCPSEAFDVITDPAFQSGYVGALERLAASKFFDDAAAMTWFLRNWSRVLAGEFDGRKGKSGRGGSTGRRKIFQLEESEASADESKGGAA